MPSLIFVHVRISQQPLIERNVFAVRAMLHCNSKPNLRLFGIAVETKDHQMTRIMPIDQPIAPGQIIGAAP